MSARDLSQQADRLVALHAITSVPLDPRFPLFQHYPAMKLGVRESVRFYADLLAPLAEAIMTSQRETTEWVVTGPPLYVVPSGANLLAWEVHRLLGERIPSHVSLRAVDLHYTRPNLRSAPDGLHGQDYSSSGIDGRIRNRQILHEGSTAPQPDPADFRDRAVLFINDINVTGTQQRFARQTLETVHPASIDWLYVIQIDPALGRSNPEVEYSLNHLKLETFEDFAEIVTRGDIDYTSRCVTRFFSYSEGQWELLIGSLDRTRRERLYELVTREGAYGGKENEDRLALLRESLT
jgi:hypothetical protein